MYLDLKLTGENVWYDIIFLKSDRYAEQNPKLKNLKR